MNQQHLHFPIFYFAKSKKGVYIFTKKSELTARAVDFFNPNEFLGDIIVDSLGKQYEIKAAHENGWSFFFGFHPLWQGRHIKVEYQLTEVNEGLDLSIFKKDLLNRINLRNWGAAYSPNELKALIERCSTFEELARLLY